MYEAELLDALRELCDDLDQLFDFRVAQVNRERARALIAKVEGRESVSRFEQEYQAPAEPRRLGDVGHAEAVNFEATR